MEPTSYKTFEVSRGLTYNYYFSKSNGSKPTLLFIHGFPSSSFEWRHQIAFFKAQGYGIVAPDMLGLGGTDKPLDMALYTASLLCRDVLDVLDQEKLDTGVVCLSHDWGAKVSSRLANSHNDRFIGFAFLAVAYMQPSPHFDIDAIMTVSKKVWGYEFYGYTLFFSSDEAAALIEAHWDSFFSMLFTADPTLWKTDFAPTGAFKKWLTEDRKCEIATYLTDDRDIQLNLLKKHGIKAALNWYKTMTSGTDAKDDKSLTMDSYTITKPVIFFGAKHDAICRADMMQQAIDTHCPNAISYEMDTDHWVHLHAAQEVNVKLQDWLEKL